MRPVGEGERGAYFGRRNAIANLAALAATTLTSLFKFVAMPL